ncbi:retron St85 family RNA-directed DNA polymerase [Pantoea agglomerans]|uniref:retron St85 family RNA-directed DNA polymerase n=1 Tax=Enterobacter agglomerans TaxID=549 RepID=UPI002F91D0AF
MKLHLYAKLTKDLDKSRSAVERYIYNAPMKYKVYTIPKRTSGQRVIAHPARKLKVFQRALIKVIEPHFNLHIKAMAYRNGIGIKHNAAIHQNNNYLLKLDFNDFFNSITPDLLFTYFLKKEILLSDAEKKLLTNTFFWNKPKKKDGKLVLSVGAPSSPFISNLILFPFDELIDDYCSKKNISYSRYADDLTFSTSEKNILFQLPSLVKRHLSSIYKNKITINEFKTVFSSKAHNRHVTGVTITNTGELSIGRERKRLISSLIHKFKIGELNLDLTRYLQGLLSFASDIEPSFKSRMELKYSLSTIEKIIKFRGENE